MNDINRLHPELKVLCLKHIDLCKKNGIEIVITQTFRTKAEQDAIYAKGRTAPGQIVTRCIYPQSPHCWGVAYDVAVSIGGKITWDRADLYEKVGAFGKTLGLTWGGDFKTFVDKPHFELDKYVKNKSVQWLTQTYGTPEKFIASWVADTRKDDDEVEKVNVLIGGKQVDGFLKDGASYIPARELENVGLKVKWDGASKTVEVTK